MTRSMNPWFLMIAALACTLLFVAACSDRSPQDGTASMPLSDEENTAIFAGGCFWCMEPPFEKLDGVLEVESGYTGGTGTGPVYEDYAEKGHVEAVRISFDPSRITYAQLLEVFWRQIDPTDPDGQFVDRGPEYRPAIFHRDEEQRRTAERSLEELVESGRYDEPITLEILPFSQFWRAEEYHQDYYRKNPVRYKFYRSRSGRDAYLEKVWGEDRHYVPATLGKYHRPAEEELRERLTPLQYDVTQEEDTEPPFDNEYWDNKREGIYVDIVSGEPLFSSRDKFKSGTGWPSFTRPLEPANIVEKTDRRLFVERTEVRSRYGDSHLGHVFDDGPRPTGLRYCINSAALRFIPKEDLEKEGYGEYEEQFRE